MYCDFWLQHIGHLFLLIVYTLNSSSQFSILCLLHFFLYTSRFCVCIHVCVCLLKLVIKIQVYNICTFFLFFWNATDLHWPWLSQPFTIWSCTVFTIPPLQLLYPLLTLSLSSQQTSSNSDFCSFQICLHSMLSSLQLSYFLLTHFFLKDSFWLSQSIMFICPKNIIFLNLQYIFFFD